MNKSSSPSILAVDAGTTAIKAALVDATGRMRVLRQRPTPYLVANPPTFEVDMDALAMTTLAVMAEVTADDPAATVEAIAITALGDGTWLVDRQGEPAAPALIWRDGRSRPVLSYWCREGRLRQVARFTGTEPTTAHQTSQLSWLASATPHYLRNAQHVLFAEDWIGFVLTATLGVGVANFEHTYGHLSQATAPTTTVLSTVLDILNLTWIAPMLLEPTSPLQKRGVLRQHLAQRLRLPSGLPVFVGPFDVLAAAIGSGGLGLAQASSVWGTAAIHQRWLDAFSPTASSYLVHHPQEHDRWLNFVATSAGMVNVDYWRRLIFSSAKKMSGRSWRDIEAHIAQVLPGAEGLVYLPYLTADLERSEMVGGPSGARFYGLHERHTSMHLLRAVYEGLAIQAARIYERLQAVGDPLTEIWVAGGGGQSDLLAQLLAHASGLRVVTPVHTEASLLGAAIVAFTGLGMAPSINDLATTIVRPRHRYLPSPSQTALYRQLSQHVNALIAATNPASCD